MNLYLMAAIYQKRSIHRHCDPADAAFGLKALTDPPLETIFIIANSNRTNGLDGMRQPLELTTINAVNGERLDLGERLGQIISVTPWAGNH